MANRKKGAGSKHVRLHLFEMETPAYRTLSSDAKALLSELRVLFNGWENRVHMSVREIRRRLNVGQVRAERARDELLDRGWIRVIEQGSFNRKVPHATVYALENEPIHNRDGATAPKSYMRWTPPPEKNTVRVLTTDGTGFEYRGTREEGQNEAHGTGFDYRKPGF